MTDFNTLLTTYFEIKRGERPTSDLSEPERRELWQYVENYIFGLERRLFKVSTRRTMIREAHDERVLAFYDFLDYCISHDKGVRWALSVFRLRFADLEGLLSMSRTGVVSVRELIQNGISSPITRRSTRISSARRECARKLMRGVKTFEDLQPCLLKPGASKKQIAMWRSYYNYFSHIAGVARTPLELNDEIAESIEDGNA